MAAVSVISVGTVNTEDNTSGTTSVVNFTAGFLKDDLLIGYISASQTSQVAAATHIWPGGWTEIAEVTTDAAGSGVGINVA